MIGVIVMYELLMVQHHKYYADVDFQLVNVVAVVVLEWDVIRALNFLIYMTLKMQSICHCDHQGLMYCQMMTYSNLVYVVYAMIRGNLMDYNHRVRMNVFSLEINRH